MLVYDEESIQKLLTYPLQREGYRVVQARDGEEALRRFSEQPVDLVVLDVMLPRLDGLEVCRRLRTESAVPIIMLTARDGLHLHRARRRIPLPRHGVGGDRGCDAVAAAAAGGGAHRGGRVRHGGR